MASWPERILHIDDDPMILELVKTIFERSDHDFFIESCENGTDALKIADSFSPDLILLDVNMPDMKADEILTRMRENPSLKVVPVILATGYADIPEAILSGKEESVILGTIKKPFSPISLLDDIKAIWDENI